jgi:dCTP deaminase
MTTLSDSAIRNLMSTGGLISNGQITQVGPACYELRLGDVYYDLTESDKPIDATKHGNVLIKPGHRVVLITQEELNIPHNLLARITSKGSLFSIGLSPVSTYADPGFIGNIGIVTQNTSDKYIILPIGESIAKIDFSNLTGNVATPYQGQHGFKTKIWPIKHQLQKSFEEISGDNRVSSEEVESFKILPRVTANALRSIQSKQRKIHWAILTGMLVNTLVLAAVSTKYFEPIVSVATNLISTVIGGVFIWLSQNRE